jgi:ABC-type sugar transport system ATPase subunit
VSLSVHEGELLAVLGPSGSGKSTLLRLVAGLEQPDAGRVLVGGRDVTTLAPAERGLAMVFQSFALFPHLTVEENIGFGLAARRTPPQQRRERVAEVSERLGLAPLLDRRPAQLSGGERQRVALARALAGRPRVRCSTSRCRTSTLSCAPAPAPSCGGCTPRSGRRWSTSPTIRPRR